MLDSVHYRERAVRSILGQGLDCVPRPRYQPPDSSCRGQTVKRLSVGLWCGSRLSGTLVPGIRESAESSATGVTDGGIFASSSIVAKESDLSNTSSRGELVRGWSASGDLLASVVAGLIIGLALDAWLGTSPWFVVGFIIVAAIGGFMKMKAEASAAIDVHAAEAIRIRDGF